MYNLSPIQQGIQSMHSIVETVNEVKNPNSINYELFKEWAKNWKTVIILNGGSSLSVEEYLYTLRKRKIGVTYFREPDLNDAISAISFIVDERVFNKTKYPDFGVDLEVGYHEWVTNIGGSNNEFLREWLPQFKLA